MLRKKEGLTLTNFFLKGVKFYQKYLSPLKPPSCRFYPTCSSYCYQAIEKYGIKKGVFLTIRRLLRCHPFCLGGYDPVD